MKKLFAILLAAVMLLACIPALAEATATKADFFQEFGMSLDIASIQENSNNFVRLESEGVIRHNPFGAMAMVTYYAIPMDEYNSLKEAFNAGSDEEQMAINEYIYPLHCQIGLIIVANTTDMNSIGLMVDGLPIEELATQGEWHYYYIPLDTAEFMELYDDPDAVELYFPDMNVEEERQKAIADIEMIQSELKRMIKEAEHVEPKDPKGALIGQKIEFETTDLDGNVVKSEDLFKANKITMVNAWGTWCTACVGELGELAKLHAEFQEKGCGIVGLEFEKGRPIDVFKADAEALLSENGITYPNVLMPMDHPIFSQHTGYPTSYFVDSEGKILTYPIAGALVGEYNPTLDKLLAGEEVEVADGSGATPSEEEKYTVHVFDTDGKPVAGVVVQFCDDITCSFQTTDENGVATFAVKEQKEYEIHVLKAPEGFRQDEQSYKTLDTYSDVNIFLDRAE